MGIALSLSFPDGFLLQVNKNQEKKSDASVCNSHLALLGMW